MCLCFQWKSFCCRRVLSCCRWEWSSWWRKNKWRRLLFYQRPALSRLASKGRKLSGRCTWCVFVLLQNRISSWKRSVGLYVTHIYQFLCSTLMDSLESYKPNLILSFFAIRICPFVRKMYSKCVSIVKAFVLHCTILWALPSLIMCCINANYVPYVAYSLLEHKSCFFLFYFKSEHSFSKLTSI